MKSLSVLSILTWALDGCSVTACDGENRARPYQRICIQEGLPFSMSRSYRLPETWRMTCPPCHALVTKSINGTVKFPPAFSDGTTVPAYVLGLSRLKIDLTKFDLRPEKGLMRASHQPWSKYPVNRILLSRLPAVLLNSLPPGENRVRAARYSR